MEKHKLLSLVKKTTIFFGEYTTPTLIYYSLFTDEYLKPMLDRMTPNDIVLFSFLIPINIKEQDIDEAYDRIETNMFSVEVAEVYEAKPEIKCPNCNNGYENCDFCNGNGEVECDNCGGSGEVDCDDCDGSGVDDEGESCDYCEGDGRKTCRRCDGSTYQSCDYCGGDGEVICDTCDGADVVSTDESTIHYYDYISWSGRWRSYFFNLKPDELLDNEDVKNFSFSPYTIILGSTEELNANYPGSEDGDTYLYVTKDTKDLNLNKSSKRITF